MSTVTVQVWDATGNKRQEVEMPVDVPMNRILAVLLQRMSFPEFAPDGQPLSYKFHHRASGKQLLDTQCLKDVGVKEGDVLRLQPEITAGAVEWHGRPAHGVAVLRNLGRYSGQTNQSAAIFDDSGSKIAALLSFDRSTGRNRGVPRTWARRPCHFFTGGFR
jgi:hypothetical protein